MSLNYYASSPIVALPPQQPSHYFSDHYSVNTSSCHSSAMIDTPMTNPRPVRPKFPRSPSIHYLATSPKLAGRKRSRDDTVDADEALPDGSCVQPPKPRGEPIFGPGMTLIYPDEPGFNVSAESQTGTWLEEKHDNQTSRPAIISRKSQRRNDSLTSRVGVSDAQLPSSWNSPASLSDPSDSDALDSIGLALGIGWKRIPESVAAAKAGWERFIANHYRVGNPVILLHSEAFKAYLVRASKYGHGRFWLFRDDLKVCQSIGVTEEIAIRSLTNMSVNEHGVLESRIITEGSPIMFEEQLLSDADVEMEL